MTIFELRWEDWEEQESYLLTHPYKTAKDFNNDVKSLCKASGNEFMKLIKKEPGALIGMNDYIRFIAGKLKTIRYIELETILVRIPGSALFTYSDLESDSARNILQESFLKKAVKHNERLLKR